MKDAKKLSREERRKEMPDVARMVDEVEREFQGTKVVYACENGWEFGRPDPRPSFKWFYPRLLISHGVPTERSGEVKRLPRRQKVEARRSVSMGDVEKLAESNLDL